MPETVGSMKGLERTRTTLSLQRAHLAQVICQAPVVEERETDRHDQRYVTIHKLRVSEPSALKEIRRRVVETLPKYHA